jgi:hypothetical protein
MINVVMTTEWRHKISALSVEPKPETHRGRNTVANVFITPHLRNLSKNSCCLTSTKR